MCRWRFPCGFAASATKIQWSEVWLGAPSCNLHVIIQLIRADLSLEVTPVKEVFKKLFNARSLFPAEILLSGLMENPGIYLTAKIATSPLCYVERAAMKLAECL